MVGVAAPLASSPKPPGMDRQRVYVYTRQLNKVQKTHKAPVPRLLGAYVVQHGLAKPLKSVHSRQTAP